MQARPWCPSAILACAIASLLLAGPGAAALAGPREARVAPLTWAELARAQRTRDFFALRDRLAHAPRPRNAPARAAAAYLAQAFDDPAASNATIATLLGRVDVPESVAVRLRVLAVRNHLRRFEYAAGAATARQILADSTGLAPAIRDDVRHDLRILGALEGVPAQTIERRGESRVALVHGRIPVSFGDSLRHYEFDTGANLSVIVRSEAQALGLRAILAGIDVGSSTDRHVTADLAVADSLAIGAMVFRHVVFLLVDDSLLTFGDFRIPGIIGFPVIEQMGEVHWRGTGEVFIPERGPGRPERNLALDDLTLLTPVLWGGERLLCRVDTGADRSILYAPAYRRLASRIDPISRPRTRNVGGAGGVRQLPVRVLAPVRLTACGAAAGLDSLDVLVRSIAADAADDYLDGNLGHDLFDRFDELIVDFRDMAIVLRGRR